MSCATRKKVFIQNEAGSDQKHLHDEKTLEWKRVVTVSRRYPFPYGFIVGTTAEDGCNVDCFVITDQPLKTGQIVECQIAGLMEQFEDGQEDHDVLATLPSESTVIGSNERERLTSFVLGVFEHIEGKRMEVGRFVETDEAQAYIRMRLDKSVEVQATFSGRPSVIPPHIEGYDPSAQSEIEGFFAEVWRSSQFPFDPERAHSDLRRIPVEYLPNGGGFWLMRLSHEIIGTVAVRRLAGNIAEVKRLNVTSRYRGRGLGERLLRHALAHAIATGFDSVQLDTIRNRGPAVRLFEKCGFLEIPRYNDNTDADLFMELTLRNSEAGPNYLPR